ncbi:MAG: ectoine/hydroxyectoine ABC transporter permease subunit EhuD [Acidimicrobiales bacterium]|nr:ectoine/hydroxyectoine ABC transporter permease subunit EhuD [Acidimicrobiales bacterium]
MWRYGGGNVRFSTDLRPKPNTTFDWDYFWALVPDMLRGLFLTVQATLLGFAIALVLGLFLAVGRRSRIKLISWPITFLIEFIRSTPLLIQLFFLYYALPDWDITLASLTTLVLGLGIHYATYCSESYRAGINSVPEGQWEAATALNLGPVTKWTRVVLPQAIPNVLPALGNNLVAGFKDAPLGSSIQVTGILAFATAASGRSFDAGVEPYTLIGIGFLMVSLPAAWLVRRLERHLTYERT